jgi:pimeloyl-ACP methyl ester carboxylesterase
MTCTLLHGGCQSGPIQQPLLTSRTIGRAVLFSALTVLLVLKFVVGHPSAEAAARRPGSPIKTLLGPSQLPFTPCWLEGSREQVLCGSYQVYENRQSNTGRKISLNIAVLPALKGNPAPDALFVLAGGPGQAATAFGPFVDVALNKIRDNRDIVLLDQRGTGDSNPMRCQTAADELHFSAAHGSLAETAHACLAKLDADPRFYSSFDFAGDLDEVRNALGYPQIDIWGGSYGTRAALVYMKNHPDRVRSAVLDGVAPYSNKIPLYEARDAQRALDMVFARCDQDENCCAAFPDVRQRFATVLSKLVKNPAHVSIHSPQTNAPIEIVVTRTNFAAALRTLLYVSSYDPMIPLVIRDASDGNFEPLVALALEISHGASEDMSRGLMFSVLCSEDVARITPQELDQATRGTFLGDEMVKAFTDACSHWPRTSLPPDFDSPVDAHVPTLLLSGELDPLTPPEWAQRAAAYLPNSSQVVVRGATHGVSSYGCVPELIARFVNAGAITGIDRSCAARGVQASFVTSPTGTAP